MKGITCENLLKSFGDPPIEIIRSISLNIRKGDFVSITGRSGSGKSTLLYLLSGLDVPTGGKVLVDEEDLAAMKPREFDIFRNQRMGFVFQFHYLLPELSALDNILMPARRTGTHLERLPLAEELLREFDIYHCRDKVPGKMSGGEQQRTAIARSLIMRPQYLFADEPTGNLDSHNGEVVMRILRHVNETFGTTVLMVTHEPDYASLARRIINLVDGRVVEDTQTPEHKAASVQVS